MLIYCYFEKNISLFEVSFLILFKYFQNCSSIAACNHVHIVRVLKVEVAGVLSKRMYSCVSDYMCLLSY